MNNTNEDSIFNINHKSASNSPKRIRYANIWTPAEQDNKLIGYLEISPEYWPYIKCGSHIRYITKNNEFRNGGFVMKNPFSYKGDTDLIKPTIKINDINTDYGEKIGFRLQNFFNRQSPDYTTWVVDYDDIMKVYLKVEASTRMIIQSLETTIESVNINLRKITDFIKKLDERLKKLENIYK
jgi:hypothetical protein